MTGRDVVSVNGGLSVDGPAGGAGSSSQGPHKLPKRER